MSRPVLGHLDPTFLEIMDDVSSGLRTLFQTSYPLTFPVSGTGSAGMDAALLNVVEAGEIIVIGVNGVFGRRMCEVASRAGGDVRVVEADWGAAIETERIAEAAGSTGASVVAVVHAETSTGVRQPVEELRSALGDDPLLVVDSVTGLGGIPLDVEGWGIDVCYSGTQKCLSVPPGLAPITFSPRAVERIQARATPVPSWYVDVTLLAGYWDEGQTSRAYHHTAPISMVYALHAGLVRILAEGLEETWRRHAVAGARLQAGLEERGMTLLPEPAVRLPQLTSVFTPEGRDEAAVRRTLLVDHAIEIGGGLGPFAGRLWRIGMMGAGATEAAADRLLDALDDVLA